MIIAVDFDGTVAEHRTFPEIGPPMPGVHEALKHLDARGHKMILWTCRDGLGLNPVIMYLKRHDLWPYFYKINKNAYRKDGYDPRKILAHVYIDDRNVGGFLGWRTTVNWILGKDNVWPVSNDTPESGGKS